MPYPRAHGYVTWFGDAFEGLEEWSVGLRLDGTAPPTTGELEALDTAFATLINSPSTTLPGGRRYLGCKWAPQTTAGRYPEGADAVEYLRPSPFSGTAAIGYPQIALVLSWRTARSRGYASNGRMYLPSSLPVAAASAQISEANANEARGNGATFIAAVNDVDLGVAVVGSTVGAGRFEPITSVRVGRVMDTQRRRRNQLPESYTAELPVPS